MARDAATDLTSIFLKGWIYYDYLRRRRRRHRRHRRIHHYPYIIANPYTGKLTASLEVGKTGLSARARSLRTVRTPHLVRGILFA